MDWKTQTSASSLRNFGHGRTTSTLLALYTLTFITLSTHLCDGQPSSATMFEIPSVEKKFYMLKDCRKMAIGDVDCRCSYIGRECQQASLKNCSNCSCLDVSIRVFYVKKRYGAVCLSANNLVNAAEKDICHTTDCTFNNLRQVWLWTPGNLLMNAETSTCLRTKQTKANIYLPMSLARCDSSDNGQKWKCNDKLWWGVSFPTNFGNITHATRYYYKQTKLIARAIKQKVDDGNTWSVFPTNNRSVCSTRHKEGVLYLNGRKLNEISQIDMVPQCPRGSCSKKLITSTSTDNLSSCTIISGGHLSRDCWPFIKANQDDGLYLMWKSDPSGRLSGKILDLTVKCLRNNTKFEEYHFRLGIKRTIFENVPGNNLTIETNSQEQSEVPIVDLEKNCTENLCSKRVKRHSTLDKNTATCFIEWKKSTSRRFGNTSNVIVNVTELLFLRKVGKERFYLKWNLTHAPRLANISFNLTILCYNDENENATVVEAFFLIFQTRYGFNSKSKSSEKSADNILLYLAIILPVAFLLLLVGVLIFYTFRRKQRKTDEKEQNPEHGYIDEEKDSVPYRIVDLQTNISCDASGYTFLEATKQDEGKPYQKLQPKCSRTDKKEAKETNHPFEGNPTYESIDNLSNPDCIYLEVLS